MGNGTEKLLRFLKIMVLFEKVFKKEGKDVKILSFGPTNCRKSFLLNPLETVFKAFVNPATDKYAWIGLDGCEVAYVNDFRWSREIFA